MLGKQLSDRNASVFFSPVQQLDLKVDEKLSENLKIFWHSV